MKQTNEITLLLINFAHRDLHSNLCLPWSIHDWFSPWKIWRTHRHHPSTWADCSLCNLNERNEIESLIQAKMTSNFEIYHETLWHATNHLRTCRSLPTQRVCWFSDSISVCRDWNRTVVHVIEAARLSGDSIHPDRRESPVTGLWLAVFAVDVPYMPENWAEAEFTVGADSIRRTIIARKTTISLL